VAETVAQVETLELLELQDQQAELELFCPLAQQVVVAAAELVTAHKAQAVQAAVAADTLARDQMEMQAPAELVAEHREQVEQLAQAAQAELVEAQRQPFTQLAAQAAQAEAAAVAAAQV
jgi:hypothetical protein